MKLVRRQFLHLAAGAAGLPFAPAAAVADDAYPSRPIHVIVGFTPGAAADVAARVLAESGGPILGQQIVVENKPGAGSSIAAEYVARAPKDGYTVFLHPVDHHQPDHQPKCRAGSGARPCSGRFA